MKSTRMRIAVCVKQVPVVSALAFDPVTRTLRREGVATEVSAFDTRAVAKAVQLGRTLGGEVCVITMGPPQARDALLDCLAMGADRALHLCDRAFAGSDTLATARALALAIRREAFDLILCGRNSVDAETGQVGPQLAELLDLPQITCVRTVEIDAGARTVTAERETDSGFETVRVPLPALLTATEDLAEELFPSAAERERAGRKPCVLLRAEDLATDPSRLGSAGSPTWVGAVREMPTGRACQVIEETPADAAAARLASLLVQEHGLFGEWKASRRDGLAELPNSVPRKGPRDVWVLAETRDDALRRVSLELLGRARQIARAFSGRVCAVLLANASDALAAALAAHGADLVLLGSDQPLPAHDVETGTALLARAIQSRRPGVLLIPSTTRGRDLAPRVAARLGLGLTGDCIDVGVDAEGHLLQYKPAFGGSIVAPVLSRTFPEMVTVRPGMLEVPPANPSRRVVVERLQVGRLPGQRATLVGRRPLGESTGDLDVADVVIGIGKGLETMANLACIEPLADLLGAALCATRDVTDAGWLPRQLQVGLTGRAISPKLYIGVAIRGAFEHMVGLRRAGVIVGINRTARAPIFKAADYGIVGDYREVVPALYRHLAALKR